MHNDELRRRSHKGSRLLEMVSAKLDKLKASVAARRIKDPATIGRRIESALSSAKMSKHIKVDVAVGSFDYSIDPESVAKEAALDGIYVIRTTVDKKQLDSAGVV